MRRPAFTNRTSTLPVTPVARRGRKHGVRQVRTVERNAVDQVVERRVVHGRRVAVAGVWASADYRIRLAARTRPSVSLKPGSVTALATAAFCTGSISLSTSGIRRYT